MNVIIFPLPNGTEMLIGPFCHEDYARLFARDNFPDGVPYRIEPMADPVYAVNRLMSMGIG